MYVDPNRLVSLLFIGYILNKKRNATIGNNRPPRIYDFKGKTLIISGMLLYDFNA